MWAEDGEGGASPSLATFQILTPYIFFFCKTAHCNQTFPVLENDLMAPSQEQQVTSILTSLISCTIKLIRSIDHQSTPIQLDLDSRLGRLLQTKYGRTYRHIHSQVHSPISTNSSAPPFFSRHAIQAHHQRHSSSCWASKRQSSDMVL